MLSQHFPILVVAVPLIASPVIVMARSGFLGWAISLAVSAVTAVMSAALLAQTSAWGTISYAIGSWPPPWGIEYRVDPANALVALLVCAVASVVLPYARRSVSAEIGQEHQYLFYALLMLCLSGLLGMAFTGDAFNMFVFLEISSLATYVLIALGRNRRALTAAYQYLVLGTAGATLYVTGVGLLYLSTGTLNFADMATRLGDVPDNRPLVAGLAFITAGIGLKFALFPLHAWLPNAYTFAPSAISAFLAGTATKVSVYVLMRVYFTVYGVDAAFRDVPLGPVLAVLSVAALFVASAAAIVQTDLKRLLAYSSVAQMGYITLGMSLGSAPGLAAAMLHIVNHGITKGALFLLAGAIALRAGGTGFDRVAGLGRTMPLTAFAFVVGGLSLIGIPGTAGFASKWALVAAAIGAGHWWIAGAVLLSSLLAVAYVWRFVECAYFREPPAGAPAPGEAPADMTGPAFVLTGAVIVAGLFAWPVMDASSLAAAALMGAPR